MTLRELVSELQRRSVQVHVAREVDPGVGSREVVRLTDDGAAQLLKRLESYRRLGVKAELRYAAVRRMHDALARTKRRLRQQTDEKEELKRMLAERVVAEQGCTEREAFRQVVDELHERIENQRRFAQP